MGILGQVAFEVIGCGRPGEESSSSMDGKCKGPEVGTGLAAEGAAAA